MSTLLIEVPESLQGFLAAQATASGYGNQSDYVLALLRQTQQATARQELESKLLAGVEALERGEGQPMTSGDWEKMREEIRTRYGDGE